MRPRQGREYEHLAQQRGSWQRVSMPWRFLIAACVCATAAAIAGAVAAAAGADWLLFGLAGAALFAAVLSLPVLSPTRGTVHRDNAIAPAARAS